MRLIRDATGRLTEVVDARSDVTGRKGAGEEQPKLREQLQHAQALESIGRLAGAAAHDFNNLLTVINGHSNFLLRQLTPGDPMYESVAEIHEAGERAARLVQQLLLLGRKPVIEVRNVNLNDIIAEVGKMLGSVIGEDIRLECVLNPSLGCVLVDPGQLHQALINLALNARDAMPGGGTLRIETRNTDLDDSFAELHAGVKPGPYVQVNVSDTGMGMTKDVMSHIFEPFFTTKKPGEGTGLGLATVYGIVRQSSGSIWVYSEPGQGTTFAIYLPRVDAGVNREPEAEPVPPPLRGTETIPVVEDRLRVVLDSPRLPGTILIVDDELGVRKFLRSILTGVSYHVLEAENGREAVQQIEASEVDLVILDLAMPEQEGIETIRILRRVRPHLKVIAISGRFAGLLHGAELFGAQASLAKPVRPDELLEAVARVMAG